MENESIERHSTRETNPGNLKRVMWLVFGSGMPCFWRELTALSGYHPVLVCLPLLPITPRAPLCSQKLFHLQGRFPVAGSCTLGREGSGVCPGSMAPGGEGEICA